MVGTTPHSPLVALTSARATRRTRCRAHADYGTSFAGLLEFRRGRGILVAGTPERGAVVQRARELVDFARHHGYRLDELIEIIEDVG